MINPKEKFTRHVACRLPYSVYDLFEIACQEERIAMSDVIRDAVISFVEKKELTNARAVANFGLSGE